MILSRAMASERSGRQRPTSAARQQQREETLSNRLAAVVVQVVQGSRQEVGLVAIGLVDRPGTPAIGRRRLSGHSSAG
jgi:hypothetical protein